MRYDLVRPCPNCPFRTDVVPFLTRARVTEISRVMRDPGGGTFVCHETTVPDEDIEGGLMASPDSQHCAGALILAEKTFGPNQMMRIAERFGRYDAGRLDMDAPVYASWGEMRRAQR